jgi:hypothetical protein
MVTTIGEKAFADAPLNEITLSTLVLPTGYPDSFDDGVYWYATLRVLPFSVSRVPDTEPWKRFVHISLFYDSTMFVVDDFVYSHNSDSTLMICGYQGESEHLVIPSTVKSENGSCTVDAIGGLAFSNNTFIIDVVIPETIKKMGQWAFSGCKNMRELTILSSELTLGNNAFVNTSIANVYCMGLTPPLGNASCFPSSVYNNAVLTVPSSSRLSYEESEPWLRFVNITSFDNNLVTDSVFCFYRTNDNEACIFKYLGNAGCVVIPDTLFIDDMFCPVISISDYAFKDNVHLQSVSIPDAVNHVGKFAFSGCSSLSQINLPDGVNYLGTGAFMNARNLTHVSLGNELTIVPDSAFYNCYQLSRALLGNNVQSIGVDAFSSCFVLDSLCLASSLSSVGHNAFGRCDQLKHVYITDMASWCQINFMNYTAAPFGSSSGSLYLNGTEIIDCVIPEGVSAIKSYAFAGCSSIRHAVLPSSVMSIGDGAFKDCLSLEAINLPVGLSFLGDFCFSNCKQLQTIVIPDSVRRIGVQAFYNCTSLFELRLGSALLSIGKSAFRNCSMLTALELPDALESLGEESFRYCSNLSSIKFGMGLKSIGAFAFATCGCLSELDLPRGVKEIGAWAFRDNKGLIKITLPDSITTISGGAFTNCNKLQQIEIPGLVVMINNLAFYGCSSLSSIVSRATAPPVIFSNSFSDDTYQNAEVFVPQSAEMSYKNDANWKRFKSIMGICMSEVVGDVNCDSEVNIADVNVLIDAMFNNDVDSVYDLNGDGEIGIGDINSLLDIILRPD